MIFKELKKPDLDKIFNLELDKIKKPLAKKKYTFKVTKKMKDHVVSLCTEKMGARELRRNIDTYITNSLGEYMLENPTALKFIVDYKDGKSLVTEDA